jgi:hypothetical protein
VASKWFFNQRMNFTVRRVSRWMAFWRSVSPPHHLNNVASGERTTDPATDLAPLCANCHAMADRLTLNLESPLRSIPELRELLIPSSNKQTDEDSPARDVGLSDAD